MASFDKPDATGRTSGRRRSRRMSRGPNSPPEDQPWVWLPRDLLESAAWLACPDSARRAVFAVLTEHMRQGGQQNGSLTTTYRDFARAGIRPPKIRLSLSQAQALGLLRLTHRGRRAHGEDPGAGHQWALTWYPVPGDGPARNEWKGHKTAEEARAIVASFKRTKAGAEADSLGEDIEGEYDVVSRQPRGNRA